MKQVFQKVGKTVLLIVAIGLTIRMIGTGDLARWLSSAATVSAEWHTPGQNAQTVSGIQHQTGAYADGQTTTTTTTQTATSVPPTATTKGDTGFVWPEVPTVPVMAVPDELGDGGKITASAMLKGRSELRGVVYSNKSSNTDIDIGAALDSKPSWTVPKNGDPLVLIMHTHETECYMDYDAGYYNKSDPTRTTDDSKNMAAVGDVITDQLRAAGIGVIHDITPHDYPKYSEAYGRSLQTVQEILKKYPTIQIILDVHRDCVMSDETTKVKPTVTIDGKKTAQVMILVGGKPSNCPYWQENVALGAKLQQTAAAKYEGLMRPFTISNGRYNQHLAPGYILLEVGSDGNTLQEALNAAALVGRSLVDVIQKGNV